MVLQWQDLKVREKRSLVTVPRSEAVSSTRSLAN